jgi:transcriptional regulator with XRE-family HTH domain
MTANDLGDYIRRRAYALDISLSETAKRAGLSRQALYKVLDERVAEAKLSTLIKLAHALNVHPLALMRRLFSGRRFPVFASREAKYPRDHAGFVRDTTFPDNETILINQEFEKKWEIQNLGEVAWADRKLVCMDDQLYILRKDNEELIPVLDQNLVALEPEISVPETEPGGTALISIRFKAPSFPCTTISYWKMVDKEGDICFPQMKGLWCKVNVVAL